MRKEETLSKMKQLKLSGMVEAYQKQMNSRDYETMSFEDRLTLLINPSY